MLWCCCQQPNAEFDWRWYPHYGHYVRDVNEGFWGPNSLRDSDIWQDGSALSNWEWEYSGAGEYNGQVVYYTRSETVLHSGPQVPSFANGVYSDVRIRANLLFGPPVSSGHPSPPFDINIYVLDDTWPNLAYVAGYSSGQDITWFRERSLIGPVLWEMKNNVHTGFGLSVETSPNIASLVNQIANRDATRHSFILLAPVGGPTRHVAEFFNDIPQGYIDVSTAYIFAA